jgi:hypothetical protein
MEVLRASGDELGGQTLLAIVLFIQTLADALRYFGGILAAIHLRRVFLWFHGGQSALEIEMKG